MKAQCLLLVAFLAASARAEYVGFVYPAGGQQGTTFQVTLGGQDVAGVNRLFVSGTGVTARIVEYNKKMNPQEIQLVSEQLRELKNPPAGKPDPKHTNLIERIERVVRNNVDQAACAAIANLIVAEVTIAPDAPTGPRELRVATPRGLSNPVVFMVGDLPEVSGPPVPTSRLIILGKEGQSLRRKTRDTKTAAADSMMDAMMMSGGAATSAKPGDLDDDLRDITLPCTVNGQITSGSVDRYRFAAKKGQRLVISVQARELVPYMADAVPGWFQPVVQLWDAKGREVAYNDDYRFKPDPVLFYTVPEDGEYLFAIHDAIYRGREDFVYRASIGELPFITGVFPLGGPADATARVKLQGVNLAEDTLEVPAAAAGLVRLTARGTGGQRSNLMPFEHATLPETMEKSSNDSQRRAQETPLPIVVNGRIEQAGDQDWFRIEGKAGEQFVAEVTARRLDSPLDAVLKFTDEQDNCLALADDNEDIATGQNTHHADSYLRVTLPADGVYYLRLTDTQHKGGPEYAYRLRLSKPQTDFAIRVVPASVTLRGKAAAYPKVQVVRKDGYTGPIRLSLKNPPAGIEMPPVTLTGTQTVANVTIRSTLEAMEHPVALQIVGTATNGAQQVERIAVGAEDRMQAFLWRHLVPAQELEALVLPPAPVVAATGGKGKSGK